jgi:hypothetical protein
MNSRLEYFFDINKLNIKKSVKKPITKNKKSIRISRLPFLYVKMQKTIGQSIANIEMILIFQKLSITPDF